MRKLLIVTALFLISSCSEKNPLEIDVSHLEADVVVERMEKKLFEAKSDELAALNTEFLQRYGDLWETYVSVMLRGGSAHDSLIDVTLDRFIHDPVMIQVYQDISAEFSDLEWMETELEDAFRHLIYYFPETKIPVVVTYNSVFNYGVATFEKHIGVGLDMYLGPENRTIKKISTEMIPQFIKEKMISEYLVVDIMRGWFETNFLPELKERDFLSRIVYEGKILYALDALMPAKEDHIKIRYTAEQLQWCEKNEMLIWRDIVDKKLLYSDNALEIKKFCDDAPFTSGLPDRSPGRVGAWMGWRMVRAYMKEHPELKLPDLIRENNARKILKSYKPEKNEQ